MAHCDCPHSVICLFCLFLFVSVEDLFISLFIYSIILIERRLKLTSDAMIQVLVNDL